MQRKVEKRTNKHTSLLFKIIEMDYATGAKYIYETTVEGYRKRSYAPYISVFPSVFLFNEISVLIERIGIVLYGALVVQFFTYPLIQWKVELDRKKFVEDMYTDLWI